MITTFKNTKEGLNNRLDEAEGQGNSKPESGTHPESKQKE